MTAANEYTSTYAVVVVRSEIIWGEVFLKIKKAVKRNYYYLNRTGLVSQSFTSGNIEFNDVGSLCINSIVL